VRLLVTVFIAILPAWALMFFFPLSWKWFLAGLLLGLAALAAAWFGGEWFVLRELRVLSQAAQQLANGDLSTRTNLRQMAGQWGRLARSFDSMAESLEQRAREREVTERALMNRTEQQTVVAALGQLALTGTDLNDLLQQAVLLVAQTLDAEFCVIMELVSPGDRLFLRAGVGWKPGCVGYVTEGASVDSQAGHTLVTGEPLLIADLRASPRFQPSSLLRDHGVVSGITVRISPRDRPFGVLGVHSKRPRTFSGDEVNFLVSVVAALATAIERSRAEAELHKLAAFAQLNPNPAMELTPEGTITYFNDAALKLALSVNLEHPRGLLPADIREIIADCLAAGFSRTQMETQFTGRTLSWDFHPVAASRIVHCYVEDITDRLNLEGQLRQAQKMESIGQLAAGVAHDFNNMLTIIQGHAGMLMTKSDLPLDQLKSSQAIYFASERAAGLTRQLLMFSRKNVMQRKPLDLREVVGNMSKMLNRLLGETIVLEYHPPSELPPVQADAGMIEQIIMNLCVNARDAMFNSGTLTINLDSFVVGEKAVHHPDARPGSFVRLRVTDTGCGMDHYTLTRIFEPFFTTKEVGKGTGLGLATVYGIVKQHEGWIEVASAVGKGTTFSIFLPPSTQPLEACNHSSDTTLFVLGGNETVLIVEDEPVLRDLAQLILADCGYKVLTAGNGPEALDLWDRYRNEIHLLFTDMVMPENISGVELAEKLLAQKPTLKIVFASGYTVDDVSTDFLRKNNNARFIQKPYGHAGLARTVRDALDGVAPVPAETVQADSVAPEVCLPASL
jgi:signal transduction histidine kinase/HAMP domain-containing protein/ActR/RegA family two-component response regulator